MSHQNKNSSDKSSQGFEPNDPNWLAFCYIADELTPEERVAFELRLEHDEQAQQSLVDAMRDSQLLYESLITTSINDSPQEQVTPVSRAIADSSLSLNKFIVATAAGIALMIGGWAWISNQPDSNESMVAKVDVPATLNDSEQLASVWGDTLAMMPDVEPEELIDDEMDSEFVEEDSDWMFVALTDLTEVDDSIEGMNRESY